MKSYKAFMASLVLMIFAVGAKADDISLYANSGGVNGKISIRGNLGIENSVITYSVLPDNINRADLAEDDINEKSYLLGSVMSDDHGDFAVDVILSDNAEGGMYIVYADAQGISATASVSHVNKSELPGLCDKLNKASTVGEVKEITDKNYRALGLEQSLYAANADKYAKDIFEKLKSKGSFDSDGLLNDTKILFSLYNVIAGDDIDGSVKEYSELFGIDYENDFKELSDSTKKRFKELLKGINNREDYKKQIVKALINARISSAGSYGELQNTVVKYADMIGISLDSYKLLNDYRQNQVFQTLFAQKPTCIDDIVSKFDNCVKSANNSTSFPSGGGGGGGARESGGSSLVLSPEAAAGAIGTEITNAGTGGSFSDVVTHWGKEYIEKLAQLKIISGYENGEFRPDNSITRAEFVTLAAAALNINGNIYMTFDDVAEGDWYYDSVTKCAGAGIINGYDGKFHPDDFITREDAVTVLNRAVVFDTEGYELKFDDRSQIADYAVESVKALCANGIVNGDDNNCFGPKSNITRAQVCALIYRILNK